MADSEVFDFVCGQLEERTALDRLEARGTVRITLKQAGLEARTVSAEQMSVVVAKLLPGELESRGIDEAGRQCDDIAAELGTLDVVIAADSPEAVFERLGS